MTKRARRRQEGLLAPRRPKRWKAFDDDYGRHVLDATRAEIMPEVRPAPVDEPTVRADHLLRKAELIDNLEVLLTAALAHAGALNSDEDLPDYSALAEEANLTLAEYEAVAMTIDGHDLQQIAKFQHVSVDAVAAARRRGLLKIRQFVSISAWTAFPYGFIEAHEGGYEA